MTQAEVGATGPVAEVAAEPSLRWGAIFAGWLVATGGI